MAALRQLFLRVPLGLLLLHFSVENIVLKTVMRQNRQNKVEKIGNGSAQKTE